MGAKSRGLNTRNFSKTGILKKSELTDYLKILKSFDDRAVRYITVFDIT